MTKSKKKKNKFEYVYLVYCNPHPPILYSVYKKKQDAIRYAIDLIRYRKEWAKEKGNEFGYYHFAPFMSKITKDFTDKDPFYAEGNIFSACLKIKDGLEWSNDKCLVKVERKQLK